MIHHNVYQYIPTIVHYKETKRVSFPYGVSLASRALSPQALLRKFDSVRDFLARSLNLSTAQREVALRLLRFWTHYGMAYPKESQVTNEPGCSKATYWRTIALLKELGLVTVINRYVRREEAQISNLYLLDKLVLAIAKYLSERGFHFNQPWLKPLLEMDGSLFWRLIYSPGFAMPPPPSPA